MGRFMPDSAAERNRQAMAMDAIRKDRLARLAREHKAGEHSATDRDRDRAAKSGCRGCMTARRRAGLWNRYGMGGK